MSVNSLRQRCQHWLDQPVGAGDPAADLADFVLAEIGRASDTQLDSSAPLVMYFAKEEDRAEFLAMMTPGMIKRNWPA